MVNVSDKFLRRIKSILKSKKLNFKDFVICFICKKTDEKKLYLDFTILPLYIFEKREHKNKIPFQSFLLYKKLGCWIVSDSDAFFHLINSRITINKDDTLKVIRQSKNSKNNLCTFIGKCMVEHLKNEKLSKKELAINLRMDIARLSKLLKGKSLDLNLAEMCRISGEFEGRNKVSSKHFVIFEKIK